MAIPHLHVFPVIATVCHTLKPHIDRHLRPPATHAKRLHRSEQQLQAIDLQRIVFNSAIDPTLPLKERLEATKVWELVTERRRILAGKPLPGAFKPEKPAVKPKNGVPHGQRKPNWRDHAATVLATAARQEQPDQPVVPPADQSGQT